MLRQLIFFAVLSVASADFLAKRQDNETALYNCHDNCGEAILFVKANCTCSNDAFVNDYKACLQCAGTENEDIWKYYGPSLSSAAAVCSLATTPLSGTQATVASATPAPTASGSSACPTANSTSSASATGTGTASASAASASSTSAGSVLDWNPWLLFFFASAAGWSI
ncbi:hypothetical protein HDK77DRAFT_210283 [Phyllosticta capitalensis]|uniref:uncharacterized protein n=1 Tax=Phyllosticta capitalensis TaxID=121624 RepID=UPI00313164E4